MRGERSPLGSVSSTVLILMAIIAFATPVIAGKATDGTRYPVEDLVLQVDENDISVSAWDFICEVLCLVVFIIAIPIIVIYWAKRREKERAAYLARRQAAYAAYSQLRDAAVQSGGYRRPVHVTHRQVHRPPPSQDSVRQELLDAGVPAEELARVYPEEAPKAAPALRELPPPPPDWTPRQPPVMAGGASTPATESPTDRTRSNANM